MVNAVEKGEAKWTKLPHYIIAGKTGTAQIPVAGIMTQMNECVFCWIFSCMTTQE